MTKKKLFTGVSPIGGKSLKSRKVARQVTAKYHKIRNEIAEIDNSRAIPKLEKSKKKVKLLSDLNKIGGIDAYQQASVISTKHFNTSKWIKKVTRNLIDDNKITPTQTKPLVFEVGAINTDLKTTSWLNVRSIDLHSQHQSIEECDFFNVEPTRMYDVVVCSMVINCVPQTERRGEMLCRLVEHFHDNGVLFFVLPLRCITLPSSDFDMASFESLLRGLGCVELIPKRCTPHLVFYVLGKKSWSSVNTNGDSLVNWKQNIARVIKQNMFTKDLQAFAVNNENQKKKSFDPKRFSLCLPSSILSHLDLV